MTPSPAGCRWGPRRQLPDSASTPTACAGDHAADNQTADPNSPSNPPGVVLSEAEVEGGRRVARAHDACDLDEIYEPFL